MRIPLAAGATVFLAALVLFVGQIPPATCRDGWQSPSIGLRGACSHHGGVERHGGLYLLSVLLSSGLGFATHLGLAAIIRRREEKAFLATLTIPAADAPPIDWVVYALRAQKDVVFSYKGQKDFEPRLRRVRPVSLEVRPGRGKRSSEPAFTGRCRDSNEERTFVYDRMRGIALAPKSDVERPHGPA